MVSANPPSTDMWVLRHLFQKGRRAATSQGVTPTRAVARGQHARAFRCSPLGTFIRWITCRHTQGAARDGTACRVGDPCRVMRGPVKGTLYFGANMTDDMTRTRGLRAADRSEADPSVEYASLSRSIIALESPLIARL
jgi:hypothetical protein